MIKLIVCDLDGTLLPYGREQLNITTVEKIKQLLSDGKNFAVSSGRIYSELREYLSEFIDLIYFISSDGALITQGDKIVFQKAFSYDAVNFAINMSHGAVVRFFSRDRVWSYNDKNKIYTTDNPILKPFDIKDPVYKIISYGAPICNFEGIYSRVHYSDGSLSEYVPPYADKGVALGALQRHLGVSLYDTVAVGDSVNDIPMMKNAKYSVCVGQACDKLRLVCKVCTDNVDSVLEKLWLGKDLLV